MDYLAILGVVMVASLLLAAAVSGWLQRGVTEPILEVARVAREVMHHRDYALRAKKTSEDEIGELVEAFNGMLAEAGRRAEALREADRRKDEFLATLAHELRNPLAPLRNAVEIMRTHATTPEMRQRALDMMDRQLRQMVRLVDDLLDVSRITTGKFAVRKARIDLRDTVRDALETVRPFVEARRHALEVRVSDAPLPVDGDAARLAQVIGNLLHNAAKYTEPGGRIELEAKQEEEDAVVRLRDNGIGLDARSAATIFEMFAQVDRSLTRAQAGLGVGLTLARRLVALHAGTVTAYSAGLGRGSEFVMRIPIAHGPAPTGEVETRLPAADGHARGAPHPARRRQRRVRRRPRHHPRGQRPRRARRPRRRRGAARGRDLRARVRVPRHRHAESARLRGRAAVARAAGNRGVRPGCCHRMGPGRRPAPRPGSRLRPPPREACRSRGHREHPGRGLSKASYLGI